MSEEQDLTGYYVDRAGNKQDIRDLGYLSVLNTLTPKGEPPDVSEFVLPRTHIVNDQPSEWSPTTYLLPELTSRRVTIIEETVEAYKTKIKRRVHRQRNLINKRVKLARKRKPKTFGRNKR